MTFVLNVLHKDYSLLVADTLSGAAEDLTVTTGSLTITVPKGGTIEGFKKIRVSNDQRLALAFAGATNDHAYLESFSNTVNEVDAMRLLRNHMESRFDFNERDKLLAGKGFMENSALLTFFDPEHEAFISTLSIWQPLSNATDTKARKANPSPFLLHIGSGSSKFEEAVGKDEINTFITSLESGSSLEERLAWIDVAFEKVSHIAAGCGVTYEAVLATRDDPVFRFVRSTTGFSINAPKGGVTTMRIGKSDS
jgi:hypothetical protein